MTTAYVEAFYADGSGSFGTYVKKTQISLTNDADHKKDTTIEFELDADLNEARVIIGDECVWSKLMGEDT